MKKLTTIAVILMLFGYVAFKYGPLWLLKFLAEGSGISQNSLASSGSAGPKPPFKDGTYSGNPEDAFYGTIQVQATIAGGKLTDVQFLQYPNDRARSIAINSVAMPNLKQEAIQTQSATVDVVSGATDSSNAFVQSLASALSKAK